MTLIYDTIANYNSYFRPLKPKIRFKPLDMSETYFTFDGFSDTNEINVIYVDAERAMGETGLFNVIIEDSQNAIDITKLRNTKVYIDFGKSQSEYKQFLIGFADVFAIRRPRSFYQEYLLTGPSTRIQAAELYLSRREASDIQNVDNPNAKVDPKYNIYQIFKNSLSKSSWRPLDKESIASLTNWTDTMISKDVSTNYPVVNEPMTTVWDFWDRLCQIGGSIWDIDYSVPDVESVLLSYNPAMHTGVTVKSGDLKTAGDDAARTSYIKSNFDVTDDSTADAGTATRLYSTTVQDRVVVTSSNGATGSTTLNNRAIAQEAIIYNDQRRITDFAFILRKIGEPDSPKSRINGDLVMNETVNGIDKPTGRVLCTFEIPIDSVDHDKKTIFVNDVDVKIRFLEGNNKVWLRLFQRSGTSGDPQNDPANTIAWHHNNLFNQSPLLPRFSATASGGDRDLKDKLSWTSTAKGPTYAFSIFSNIRRLQARTNWQQAKLLRMKEAVIDSSYLSDPKSIAAFMSIGLARRSKARRGVAEMTVTVPNNFLYTPYQWVSFSDGLSDVSQDLQVQRSRIVVSALAGDPQIGALDMNITLGGLFNSLIGNCSCT